MNNIIIKGRISKDIELRTTQTGKEVAGFSVAVNRRFDKDNTDFFDIVAWGKTGVFVNTYFRKGQEILIQGSMQCRKWQDTEGHNRYSWELIADNVEFCGSKSEGQPASAPTNICVDPIPDDGDLPF